MRVMGIHHVTLIADDLDRAAWFYGQVLGLEQIERPAFDVQGLFFRAGDGQEIHITLAARPLTREPLYFQRADGVEDTARYIHRHVALRIADLQDFEERLEQAGITILFSESRADPNDQLAANMIAGWRSLYGQVPMVCEDPFENMLELLPFQQGGE